MSTFRAVTPARPCTGHLTPAGQPRHPQPAGVDLEVSATYAVDYGLRGPRGEMVPLDLSPLLDAIAARFDGCQLCEQHQVDRIAAEPPLVVQTVGAALLVFTGTVHQVPADLVVQKLDVAGAAIALTMRTHGLLAATDTAAAMPVDQRGRAAAIALNHLVPAGKYAAYLSNDYPPRPGQGRPMRADDRAVLAGLGEDGYPPR
jgi:hypothetical protein